MKQTGVVLTSGGGKSLVRINRHEACIKCGQCGGARSEHNVYIEGDYPPGQVVELHLESNKFLRAIGLLYVLPVIFLFAGLLLGYNYAGNFSLNPDMSAVLFAAVFLMISSGIVYISDKFIRRNQTYQPYIKDDYEEERS